MVNVVVKSVSVIDANNPSVVKPIGRPQASSPYLEPKNSIILAVNLVPAFALHDLSTEQMNNLMTNMKNKTFSEYITCIHAMWVIDENDQHINWKSFYSNEEIDYVLEQILEYVRCRGNGVYEFLHRAWGNRYIWKELVYDVADAQKNWKYIKTQFRNIATAYLDHGYPAGYLLPEYIDDTLSLFKKVNPTGTLSDSHLLDCPFANTTTGFSTAEIVRVFLASENCGKRVKVEFASIKVDGKSVCVMKEIYYKFDIEKNIKDHHTMFKCDNRKHNRSWPCNHSCVTFLPSDRAYVRKYESVRKWSKYKVPRTLGGEN